ELAEEILPTARRITLYASANDQAMQISRSVNGAPRAGDTTGGPIVVPGIDTIDASDVRTELFSFNHDYFASQPSILSDMTTVIVRSFPPAARDGLREQRLPTSMERYWRILVER
ncbi:MAG: alpha/beta hydrolase, partial [Caulobacterales bacterium]|nr:alpha/beta hydrolase [Caulobacterales bacterium]